MASIPDCPAPACSPTITHATHRRSSSSSSTSSSTTSISSNSSDAPNDTPSLRERRGVDFRLSSTQLSQTSIIEDILPEEPHRPTLKEPWRRRALPTPIALFEYDVAMGKAGAKSAGARDYGMGEDGWTVVVLHTGK